MMYNQLYKCEVILSRRIKRIFNVEFNPILIFDENSSGLQTASIVFAVASFSDI